MLVSGVLLLLRDFAFDLERERLAERLEALRLAGGEDLERDLECRLMGVADRERVCRLEALRDLERLLRPRRTGVRDLE